MPRNHYDSDAEPQRRLPALHDVLGDVLEQRPYSPSPPYSPHDRDRDRDHSDSRRSTPNPHREYTYEVTSSHRDSYHRSAPPQPLSHQYPHSYPPSQRASTPRASSSSSAHAAAPAAHAYHLFNLVPDKGLVHQRTSAQEQDLEPSHPRPRLPPSDPARKYVCPDCGNRFSKHSTLRNHLLTHSGEKPFMCTQPGCGRRFSMACNMQRHLRTHTSASAFQDEGNPHQRMPSTQPSSRGGSRASSWEGSSRGGSPAEAYYHHRK